MKFVRYATESGPALGSLKESGAVYAVSGDMFGDYEVGAQVGTVDDLELLAPVDPGNVIAVGANYLAHILEGHDEDAIPKFPMLFMKPNSAITGPGAPIVLPDAANFTQSMNDPDLQKDPFGEVHYEAELVAVIGTSAGELLELGQAENRNQAFATTGWSQGARTPQLVHGQADALADSAQSLRQLLVRDA